MAVRFARLLHSRLARLGAIEVGLVLALFTGTALMLVFWWVADEVVEGDTDRLDRAILAKFRHANNPADLIGPPWLEEMVRDITALGSYAFITILVAAAICYLLLVRHYRQALLLLIAEGGGMLLSNALKFAFARERPDVEHAARVFTSSFPSGHATLSAVTFLTLGALMTRTNADRRVKIFFIGLAVVLTIMVGISRIYLGVHYPSDVVAGWCVGSAWALLCWSGALWMQRRGTVEKANA